MAIIERRKTNNLQGRKILWVSPIILDTHLHKTAFLHISRQFAELGYDSSIIAVQSGNVPQIENSQVRIISVPLRYVPVVSPVMFTVVLFFFLPIYIILSKPDFIIMYQPEVSVLSSIPGLLVSKFKRVKFVLDVRSTPVETVGFRGFMQTFWFSTSVLIAKKLFDGTTIITSLMKKEVCNRFHINPNKVGIWTAGVSTTLFNPKNYISESTELRRKLGLSGKFVVFYHGVFTATRGLTETIKAIKILKHKHPDVAFFLLGTGPIVSMLKALIQEEGLQDNVIIHNPVNHAEVPKFIGMCDVGIVPLPYHPYWRFQCPLKLLEYLAMEKVVIVTDIPAHRAVVGEWKCGIYASSAKPSEIAKSITYAYHNREKLEKWGKFGRTIVNERYTWEKVAEDLENYLLSIEDRVG